MLLSQDTNEFKCSQEHRLSLPILTGQANQITSKLTLGPVRDSSIMYLVNET